MDKTMFDLSDYGAIVTGGANGIGLAYAEVLLDHGARVTILDFSEDALGRELERLQRRGFPVDGAVVDVTDAKGLQREIDAAADRYGRLDVCFANAGGSVGLGYAASEPGGPRPEELAIENYAFERWQAGIDTHLHGVFHTAKAVVRHMKPRRSGRIIVTTSAAAIRNQPAVGAAYMAAKAGAAHLVRNLALELARYNILVNAIAPGPFITNIADGFVRQKAVQDAYAKKIPLGRMAHTDEMKGMALLLASPASSFITGQQFVVDGGYTVGSPD